MIAISLGGYYSPRCASLEPRFAACIAWGAIWDYHATWKRRIDAAFKTSLSVDKLADEAHKIWFNHTAPHHPSLTEYREIIEEALG